MHLERRRQRILFFWTLSTSTGLRSQEPCRCCNARPCISTGYFDVEIKRQLWTTYSSDLSLVRRPLYYLGDRCRACHRTRSSVWLRQLSRPSRRSPWQLLGRTHRHLASPMSCGGSLNRCISTKFLAAVRDYRPSARSILNEPACYPNIR